MIIGIDANEANQQIRVGSGVYALELLRRFKKYQTDTLRANIKYRIYLKEKPIIDLPKEEENWQYKIVGPQKFWTQIGLPIELWKEKLLGNAPDIFFTPSHYAPRFCPVPTIITIFDLSFIKFPEMFRKKDLYQLQKWTAYSIKAAKKIITISEFSKKEISDYYKIKPDKILVAYPGFDENKYQKSKIKNKKYISKIKNKFKIDTDYILYVGTIQPRKNLERLIEAFRKLKTTTKNLKLVIAGMISEGRGGWMNENFKSASDVIVTGFIPNDDLPHLLAGARVLVLPSLYEGFGIPVIEAMATGIPTVVSNVSSLPEIVGEASVLVDPYDIVSISDGLKEACYNNFKREILIKRGLQQVKNYSWEKSASAILNVLTKR